MNNEDAQIEKKSYRKYFYIFSLLLLLSFLWSVYDDNASRRPWKDYQRDFFRLETDKLQEELEKAKKAVDSKTTKEIKERLVKLKNDFNSQKKSSHYRDAVKNLNLSQQKFLELFQKTQFEKNVAEEIYYHYQHAFDSGEEYESKKKEWEKQTALIESWKPELEEVERKRDEASKVVQSYHREIDLQEKLLKEKTQTTTNLENKIRHVSRKTPEIKQIVIEGFSKNNFGEPILKVDRCTSCHMGVNKKGLEDFPEPFRTHKNYEMFAKHPIERFGCTTCHDGQGEGTTFYDAGHSPTNKEQEKQWIEKYGWKPISHWPKPMLAGDFTQSSCLRCHTHEEDIPGAPVLTKGINLFRETLGCVNCHLVKGHEDVNKIGPDLKAVGSKVKPSWLFKWVKSPKSHHTRTRMPNFKLADQEVTSVVAYLMSLKGDQGWKKYRLKDSVTGDTNLISRGKELVRKKGCVGCHSIAGFEIDVDKTRDMAPSLSHVGNKTSPEWIMNWVLDPTRYSPTTLMPNLRLTPREGRAIAAYLTSIKDTNSAKIEGLTEKIQDEQEIKKGLAIISDYGCYGCHNIPGTEKLSRVGAELTDFGRKELYELAFGYAKDVERSWLGYTRTKMLKPRSFVTEKVLQRMPAFELSEEEAHSLAVFLKSFRGEKTPKEFTRVVDSDYIDIQNGRKLIKKYNCVGCHEIEKGWGGKNILSALKTDHSKSEMNSYAPPTLMGEGHKVQSEWLFNFIFKPSVVRPWLTLKMPTFNFSSKQVNDIVKYFQASSKVELSYHFWKKTFHQKADKDSAKQLFELLKCVQCHSFGKGNSTSTSVAELAPDLNLAKNRLRPDWIMDWLRNPQKLQPGTKMPNFFIETDEEDGEVMELLPEPEKKMSLLKRFLFEM